jgi:hypothetical protein
MIVSPNSVQSKADDDSDRIDTTPDISSELLLEIPSLPKTTPDTSAHLLLEISSLPKTSPVTSADLLLKTPSLSKTSPDTSADLLLEISSISNTTKSKYEESTHSIPAGNRSSDVIHLLKNK